MKKFVRCIGFTVAATTVLATDGFAQFSLGAQLRTRTELRDGQGTPSPKGSKPGFFTSQRTRLTAGYNMYRLQFGLSLQDVRVWGQDGSTINRTTTADNNGLMLHEAWAEIGLTDTSNKKTSLTLKIGRQEISYDDQRLIDSLDWLQQARRHDAAVLKLATGNWSAHAGFAFNQNKESSIGTKYNSTPAGNYGGNTNGGSIYKSMEYLYTNYKLKTGSVSFLFLTDQFSKYHTDIINATPTKVWEDGVWNRYTTGLYFNNNFGDLNISAAAYYQGGNNSSGQKTAAGLLSASALYSIGKKFSIGPGIDYTAGGTSNNKNNIFDPLYGTPHKFWGLMDYFYAANGFGSKGLTDYFLKAKYKPSKSVQLTADLHQFSSATSVYDINNNKLSRSFGQELDITGNYALTKVIGFEAGYSHFFSTASLASVGVKNVPDAQKGNNWAYLQINIKPEFLK
jgi:hypothetical protein